MALNSIGDAIHTNLVDTTRIFFPNHGGFVIGVRVFADPGLGGRAITDRQFEFVLSIVGRRPTGYKSASPFMDSEWCILSEVDRYVVAFEVCEAIL